MIEFNEIVSWVAPAATMIAACMTAANLGPRVTGWGFVVFTIGSLAWVSIAVASGQQSLLVTNAFLTLVNAVGIWRWLGRIARFDDGAKSAEAKSRQAQTDTLFNVGSVEGRAILDTNDTKLGGAIGVMARAHEGSIAYVVAALGGIAGLGERIVALPWRSIEARPDGFVVHMSAEDLAQLDTLDSNDWPHKV